MTERLQILLLSPPHFRGCLPNTVNSGSIEQTACLVGYQLANMGHTVTLYATGDTDCPPNVHHQYHFEEAPENYYALSPEEVLIRERQHVHQALKDRSRTDTCVMNFTMVGIEEIEKVRSTDQQFTTNSTVHWPTNDKKLKPFLETHPQHPYVVMSSHQEKDLNGKNVVGIAPPGVEIGKWPYTPGGEYLLFVGKIMPEKGPDLAIQAALQTDMPLKIAGRVINERYPNYFDTYIKPYLSQQIEYVGEIHGDEKIDLFKNARALLVPGRWKEPFGVVSLEAQACGKPVIPWNPGTMNDSIIDGETGFVVKAQIDDDKNAVREMVQFIRRIDEIDPHACRKNIENHFTSAHTAQAYVTIFQRQMMR